MALISIDFRKPSAPSGSLAFLRINAKPSNPDGAD